MSSTDATANGQAAETEGTPNEAVKGGLVKSEASEGTVMVLEDKTRLVQSNTLPNNRPIAVSDFEVVSTLTFSGMRPVMADTFKFVNLDTLPGGRPVAVSTLEISDIGFLPGNRPIASNDIDEAPSILMGYLD